MWPFRKKELRGPAVDVSEPAEYGHFRILRRENGHLWELGHGAMGITYKAEDTNLYSPVALKVINPLIAGQPGARDFFLTEARGAASLRHRNAAAVHHLGINQAGELYFAMEFIDGETVDALIRRQRRLGVALALDVAQQTACALAAAAQRGLVHRDLKPGNLMLCDEGDGSLIVKVIDFGLTKSLRPAQRPDALAESTKSPDLENRFVGTLHYASPEQIRCDPQLDCRSDFYSLGATLWTMLSGHPPFEGSSATVRQRHLEEAPQFARLPEDVSPPVRELLASLLHKDPAGRPRTPLELIDRIELAAYEHRGAEADPRKTWKAQGCVPLIGSVLAHNYHLEALADDEQATGGNPVFRAEDVGRHRPVAVQLLDRDRPLDDVRDTMKRFAAVPHANLVEHVEFSSCRGQPFLVNEWVNGFPLIEVVRARGGALTPVEVQILIRQATRAVDHAGAHGLGPLDLQSSAIQVHFAGAPLDAAQRRNLPGARVDAWPEFTLKLRPWIGRNAGGAESPAGDAGSRREAIRLLGHLAAELLGSSGSSTAAFSEVAGEADLRLLPAAPQAVQRIINRAVASETSFNSGDEFSVALTAAFGMRED